MMRHLLHIILGKGARCWGLGFLLGTLISSPCQAWNEDYAYGLPQERRMCVQREDEQGILFTSIEPDADCPPEAKRYIVIFGKEPKGAMALIPTSTSLRFYPPLTLHWPAKDRFSASPLWHFTCVGRAELNPLGVKLSLQTYRGEITSGGKEDCLEAERRALAFCKKEWQGEALLEICPLSWSSR